MSTGRGRDTGAPALAICIVTLLLLPLALAGHEGRHDVFLVSPGESDGETSVAVVARIVAQVHAVEPPTQLSVELRLTSLVKNATVVSGSVVVTDADGNETSVLEVARTVPGFATESFTVPLWINATGRHNVRFASEGPSVSSEGAIIQGLLPVEVRVEQPAAGEPLVLFPGQSETIRVNLTSRASQPLVNVTLSGEGRFSPAPARLATLAPGASRVLELTADASVFFGERSRGPRGYVDRSEMAMGLSAELEGRVVQHPLHETLAFPPARVVLPVYVLSEPAAFVTLQDGALGEPGLVEVTLVNPGASSIDRTVRVTFSKNGFPDLTTVVERDMAAAAGSRGEARFLWTPRASGEWSVRLEGSGIVSNFDQVAVTAPLTFDTVGAGSGFTAFSGGRGPGGFGASEERVDRGDAWAMAFNVTPQEPLQVRSVGIAASRIPFQGPFSVRDAIEWSGGSSFWMKDNETRTIQMDLTAKASGWYDLSPVVETEKGFIVGPQMANVQVRSGGAGWLTFSAPFMLLAGLLVGQIAWRRFWVS